MATLTIASKANQATTLPALLVASYANESDPNVSITLKFEEVEVLEPKDSPVDLIVGNDPPIHGFPSCLDKLAQEYPVLSGKHDDLVGF
jgi:glutamyl-tRNA synthetase